MILLWSGLNQHSNYVTRISMLKTTRLLLCVFWRSIWRLVSWKSMVKNESILLISINLFSFCSQRMKYHIKTLCDFYVGDHPNSRSATVYNMIILFYSERVVMKLKDLLKQCTILGYQNAFHFLVTVVRVGGA